MIFDGRATGDSSFTDEIGLPGAVFAIFSSRARQVGSAAITASTFMS